MVTADQLDLRAIAHDGGEREFTRVASRKTIYGTLEELQDDLEIWLQEYIEHRPYQGRWCYGNPPMQTLIDSVPLAKEKLLAANGAWSMN